MTAWKQILLTFLLCLGLSFAAYFFYEKVWVKKTAGGQASLAVYSLSSEPFDVTIGSRRETTPFRDDAIGEGEPEIILSNGKNTYRTKVPLLFGTQTSIHWKLGRSQIFNEGSIIWLEKTKGDAAFLVISDPDGAEVRLDETYIGQTPMNNSEIRSGEHTLKITKIGYSPREVNINLVDNYKLNIKVKLSPVIIESADIKNLPFPEEPRLVITDFSTAKEDLLAEPIEWLSGLLEMIADSRVAAAEEIPANYDYFVDVQGNLYNGQGIKLAAGSEGEKTLEKMSVGYLGRTGENLTPAAKEALLSLTKTVFTKTATLEILPTGLGWLRVRGEPSLNGPEIGKVNTGEKFEMVEEKSDWYKIKMSDGQIGWISAQYAKKN